MGKLRLKPQAFDSNSYTANNYRILPLNNSLAVSVHISIIISLLDTLTFTHVFICLCILSNYVFLLWKAGATVTLPPSLPLSLPSYLPPFLEFLSFWWSALYRNAQNCLFFVIIRHLAKTLASLGAQSNQAKTHKVVRNPMAGSLTISSFHSSTHSNGSYCLVFFVDYFGCFCFFFYCYCGLYFDPGVYWNTALDPSELLICPGNLRVEMNSFLAVHFSNNKKWSSLFFICCILLSKEKWTVLLCIICCLFVQCNWQTWLVYFLKNECGVDRFRNSHQDLECIFHASELCTLLPPEETVCLGFWTARTFRS